MRSCANCANREAGRAADAPPSAGGAGRPWSAGRGQRPQDPARLEPRQHVLRALGIDRLAERLAADVLARDLGRPHPLQPAHDAAGGPLAARAPARSNTASACGR